MAPMMQMRITDAMIRAAATALANGAGARNGAPPITNVLDMLSQSMRDRYLGDAKAALEAAKAAQDAGA